MTSKKTTVTLRGGPADGTRFRAASPAPEIVTVPVMLADGLGECRYYRTDETIAGMPVYEYPSAIH